MKNVLDKLIYDYQSSFVLGQSIIELVYFIIKKKLEKAKIYSSQVGYQ